MIDIEAVKISTRDHIPAEAWKRAACNCASSQRSLCEDTMKTIITPFNSFQSPWHIACARRMFVIWATLPAIWSEAFLTTWASVYRRRK